MFPRLSSRENQKTRFSSGFYLANKPHDNSNSFSTSNLRKASLKKYYVTFCHDVITW